MAAPAGYTELGLCGFSPKGDYVATAIYNKYNTVLYDGITWYCKQNGVTGTVPADGITWGKVLDRAQADDSLSDTSTYPVKNKVIKAALDEKQNKTLETAIEGETEIEDILTALSNKSVAIDDETIKKNATTEKIYAATATSSTLGVSKPDDETIEVDTDGVLKVKVKGTVAAYIVGTLQYAATWLSTTSGGTAFTPAANTLYRVLTPGNFYNLLFTWDGTRYILAGQYGQLQRGAAYSIGDTLTHPNLPSWAFIVCSTAGTTGASEPALSTVTDGDFITDGTAAFKVRDLRASSGVIPDEETIIYNGAGALAANGFAIVNGQLCWHHVEEE